MCVICGLIFTKVLFADTAERCVELMLKRVHGNSLDLSNCNPTAIQAPIILSFLNSHQTVNELNISDNSKFGNEGMKILAQNTTLQTLAMANTGLTADGYKALANNNFIKHLNSDNEEHRYESDKAPIGLEGNKSLINLSMAFHKVGDNVAMTFANILTLKEVDLTGSKIQDAAVLALNNLPNLKTLRISGNYYSDDTGAIIASNPKITDLGLNAGTKTLAAIANNKNIEKLDLDYEDNDVPAFNSLKNKSGIKVLSLYGPLTNELIAIIATMKDLEELTIRHYHLTSEYPYPDNLYRLGELHKLKKLSINSWYGPIDIDVRTATALANNHSLKEVYLDYVNESSAIALSASTTLQVINIRNILTKDIEKILNESLAKLAAMPSLKELSYVGDFKFDNSIARAINKNQNLQIVHISGGTNASAIDKMPITALKLLAKNTHVTDLELTSKDINDTALKVLAANTILRKLKVESNNVTDNGIKALAQNKTLEYLTLDINPVTSTAYNQLMANKNIPFIDVNINWGQV